MIIGGLQCAALVGAQLAAQASLAKAAEAERERFSRLSPEAKLLELREREVRALERIASNPPVINVRSSIF